MAKGNKPNGSRARELAAQFKAQSQKAVSERWTREVKLPIPTIAPDFVFEFVAKRVDLMSMLYAGQLPEAFVNSILNIKQDRADAAREAEDSLQTSSMEEKQKLLDFQVRLALEICHEPKLVFREAENDNEVDIRDLPFSGDLILALFNYGMNLSPDVPVALKDGGETTVAAVETFPDGQQGEKLPSTGNRMQEFRNITGIPA